MSLRATLIAAAVIETVILSAAPAHADPQSDYINACGRPACFLCRRQTNNSRR